jgi:hypothetical protein
MQLSQTNSLFHAAVCCAPFCPRADRMLTHPVTGKPLLLGPAVGAKTSRLGNNSLGTRPWVQV